MRIKSLRRKGRLFGCSIFLPGLASICLMNTIHTCANKLNFDLVENTFLATEAWPVKVALRGQENDSGTLVNLGFGRTRF